MLDFLCVLKTKTNCIFFKKTHYKYDVTIITDNSCYIIVLVFAEFGDAFKNASLFYENCCGIKKKPKLIQQYRL